MRLNNGEDCANKFKSNKYLGLLILLGIFGGNYLKNDDFWSVDRNIFDSDDILRDISIPAQQHKS